MILKSKLFNKTSRILHKHHTSSTHKQLQTPEASCKPEHTIKYASTARQRERNPKRTAPSRKVRETNGRSSVASRRPLYTQEAVKLTGLSGTQVKVSYTTSSSKLLFYCREKKLYCFWERPNDYKVKWPQLTFHHCYRLPHLISHHV